MHDDGDHVQLGALDGRQMTFDAVVLANGADLPALLSRLNIGGVALDVTSGQVSQLPATPASSAVKTGLSFGGYLTPAHEGMHELGATFDRDARDGVTLAGHRHNLALLPGGLADIFTGLDPAEFGGRTSRRASTPDRNPIWGALAHRVYVLGALGARGFTFAPLLGDQLAAQIMQRPISLDLGTRAMLDPFRFRLRRGRLCDACGDIAGSLISCHFPACLGRPNVRHVACKRVPTG
jgi:tRNA 5-methylaminomethyl-2-thiouridine biosynthesis bifunctional protein